MHPLIKNSAAFVSEVTSRLRVDSFVNLVRGIGSSRDSRLSAQVKALRPLTIVELEALFHNSDLAAKMVGKLPEDGTRRGWDLPDNLRTQIGNWGALSIFREAWTWGRLYGFGAIVLGLSDRLGAPDQPLDLDRVCEGDLRYLLAIEAQDLSPVDTVRDRESPHYGAVRLYRITSAEGNTSTVHASRLITFGGALTSDRVRAANQQRDLSVLQRPFDILRDADQSWQSVMLMIGDLSQAVFKIKGLMEMIANGQKQVILDRMEIVDVARSATRAVVLDAESESFDHVGAANLAAVDPLLLRLFQRLAAASDMPVSILMGIAASGLNATGESELRSWYSTVQAQQQEHTQQAQKLIHVIARNAGLPVAPATWLPLWQPTETELIAYEKTQAEVSTLRINSQVTSAREEREALSTGKPISVVVARGDRGAREEITASIDPEIGSIWTDTEDGHRLEITAVSDDRVYFLDLDSPNPERQWRWRLASFLERCREQTTPAPAV